MSHDSATATDNGSFEEAVAARPVTNTALSTEQTADGNTVYRTVATSNLALFGEPNDDEAKANDHSNSKNNKHNKTDADAQTETEIEIESDGDKDGDAVEFDVEDDDEEGFYVMSKLEVQSLCQWIPLRLTPDERRLLQLLEGALDVSEYVVCCCLWCCVLCVDCGTCAFV